MELNAQSPYLYKETSKPIYTSSYYSVVNNNIEDEEISYYVKMWEQGRKDYSRGWGLFLTSTLITTCLDVAIIYNCDDWTGPLTLVSSIGAIIDGIGLYYIYRGSYYKSCASLMISTKGIVYRF